MPADECSYPLGSAVELSNAFTAPKASTVSTEVMLLTGRLRQFPAMFRSVKDIQSLN